MRIATSASPPRNDGGNGVVTCVLFICVCSGSSFLAFSTFRLPGSSERHSEPVTDVTGVGIRTPLAEVSVPSMGTGERIATVYALRVQ